MSKSTDQDTSGRVTETGRVGVYGDSDRTSDGGRATGSPSETVGVHDRPASADRSRMTPTVIAIVAAALVAILLLIWIL